MVPIKKLSEKEASLKIKPWITKGILTSIKVWNKLDLRYLVSKTPIKKSLLLRRDKQYRNLIVLYHNLTSSIQAFVWTLHLRET